jgi:hypothetical protein
LASSEPWVTIVGPAMVSPKKVVAGAEGRPASLMRSSTRRCSGGGAPRPPKPSGKWTQASPRSYCLPRNVTGSVLPSVSASSCSRRSSTSDVGSAMDER